MNDIEIDNHIIDEIFEAAEFELSDILPSDWAEKNRFMTSEVSPIEGPFSFKHSPYTKEILDQVSPTSPARVIVVKKGAQVGFSTSVIENAIGWIISENPGNVLFLVGHDDLIEKAMKKVDQMLDSTGIRPLIKSTANRSKNNKSGDKDRSKEFPGGMLSLGISNHKTLRQQSLKYGFIDDFEAMKSSTKESGGTVPMIKQRFAAYAKSYKLFEISTPEVLENSNIEGEYLKGDQRKFHVPCPCCGEFIVLYWEIDSEINAGEKAGIYWELNESGQLDRSSVGYICQKCGDFFSDKFKPDMLSRGYWVPTAEPLDPTYVSYHINSLYASAYMFGWSHYAQQYLDANPPGQPRKEDLHQTFVNLVLGEPYEMQGETIEAESLMHNIRPYQVGVVPEKQSIADGNGRIIMLTLGSDMNGTAKDEKRDFDDDARLDWEIIAWSETGSSYSVNHGSIGTFQPSHIRTKKEHNHPDRVKWTYKRGAKNCVWDELDNILGVEIPVDTGRKMQVFAAGLDTGHLSEYAYPYIEATNHRVYGVKGDKMQNTGVIIDSDNKLFNISKENAKLWLVNVNRYKDILATSIGLNWDPHITPSQPADYLNFPTPSNGKYARANFFEHFESEHKVVEKGRYIWKKRSIRHQNHLFDCRIYGMAIKDIIVSLILKKLKIQNGTWGDFVKVVTKQK